MDLITKTRKQGNSITLTVPSEFKIAAGVAMKPKLTPKGIFYEFAEDQTEMDLSTTILKDLVAQGYKGEKLVDAFEKRKKAIAQQKLA